MRLLEPRPTEEARVACVDAARVCGRVCVCVSRDRRSCSAGARARGAGNKPRIAAFVMVPEVLDAH